MIRDSLLHHDGSNDLQELSLNECKSYLRRHKLRVCGTKEECIQRIKEHERLKCGKAEALYPISSFSINCTGDACKGDTVLFEQDIMKGVNIVGKRIIAGRILNESYSASSLHTFSVEVLWSNGPKKLNPLSLLLLKGRNFYKFGTFRQPWDDEAERLKVLEEKHSRGDAARRKWKLRRKQFALNTIKRAMRPKVSHYERKSVLLQLQKTKFKRSRKLIFRPVLSPNTSWKWKKNRNSNIDSDIYPDHIQQEASPSFPNDGALVPFGHHRNQQRGPNHVFNQLPLKRFKSLYIRSSFSIDCTDDACKGDVVLFKQNKYGQGKIVRKKRTIAGRIVEETYGASDKQRTFTVELLWTKPATIKLSPTSTLQVRDSELYKFGTLRQPWEDEAKRPKSLIKKHQPVLAAGQKRKVRETDIASNNNQGAKRQKLSGAANVKDCITTHKKKTRSQMRALKWSAQKMFHPEPFQWSFPKLNPNLIPYPNLKPEVKPDSNPNSTQDTNSSPQKMCHLDQFQWSFPNLNPNLIPSPNLKPEGTPDSNPNSAQDTNSSPNPNSNSTQATNSSPNPNSTQATISSPNPNPNPYPNSNQDINPSPNPNPNPNQSKQPIKTNKLKSAKRQGLVHVKDCTSIHKKKKKKSKKKRLRVQKKQLKRPTQPNLNPKSNLKPKGNPDPNVNSNRKTNPSPTNLDPNSNSNRETNPNPNRYVHVDDHLQEASSSLSYDRTLLPNQTPFGFPPHQSTPWLPPNQAPFGFLPNQPSLQFFPNQQPFVFPPNQHPFTFPPNQQPFTFPPNQPQDSLLTLSGHGEQWRPNYAFHQPSTLCLETAAVVLGLISFGLL
ncbi:uncharacterized protein [Rutidosis leptorrhynchoides]|uniref:uncharacterized protein isoform X2 n=1 Tax=Rutidosis leptorrhynchoides TaxID=125765 RepID=UPI003A98DDB4